MQKLTTALGCLFFLLTIPGCQTTHHESGKTGRIATQAGLVYITNEIAQDTHTGKMWQVEKSKRFKTFAEAEAYTQKLNLGGYKDWRVPTVMELYDLYQIFDHKNNGSVTMNMKGDYWAKDELMGVSGSWNMDTMCCDPYREFSKNPKGRIRAIRP